MKKKILLSLVILLSIFAITGCGNSKQDDVQENQQDSKVEKNNNLYCKGKVSFLTDFLLSTGPMTADNPKPSDDPSDWTIAFPEEENDDIENSELTFVYDKNNNLSIQGKEIYTKSYSSQISDEDLEKMNGEIDGNTYKTYKKDGKVIIEYTIGSNFDLIKAFNVRYKTKDELKKALEENTTLVCK